jgi:hypothetical protein
MHYFRRSNWLLLQQCAGSECTDITVTFPFLWGMALRHYITGGRRFEGRSDLVLTDRLAVKAWNPSDLIFIYFKWQFLIWRHSRASGALRQDSKRQRTVAATDCPYLAGLAVVHNFCTVSWFIIHKFLPTHKTFMFTEHETIRQHEEVTNSVCTQLPVIILLFTEDTGELQNLETVLNINTKSRQCAVT